MTGILLVAVLGLSPGIRLADSVGPRHAGLIGGTIRLVDDQSYAHDLEAMTHDEAQAELSRLESSRPGLVGPVVLLSIGGGVTLLSIAFFTVDIIAGVVVLIAAAALGVVGGILLGVRLVARGTYAAQLRAAQHRLDALEPQPPAPPPPPPDAPPPPPPPGANFLNPAPGLLVATF